MFLHTILQRQNKYIFIQHLLDSQGTLEDQQTLNENKYSTEFWWISLPYKFYAWEIILKGQMNYTQKFHVFVKCIIICKVPTKDAYNKMLQYISQCQTSERKWRMKCRLNLSDKDWNITSILHWFLTLYCKPSNSR